MTRIAFVCVGNAGRSQLATALAEHEREQRKLDVIIVTGGTDPNEHVHPEVVTVLEEMDIEGGVREPRPITSNDVEDAAYIITMGCSVDEFAPPTWDGTAEQWDLTHPGGDDLDAVRAQRDEIHNRVKDLFDRIEEETA